MEHLGKEGKKFWDVRWPRQINPFDRFDPSVKFRAGKLTAGRLGTGKGAVVGREKKNAFPRSVRFGAGAVVVAFFTFFILADRFRGEEPKDKARQDASSPVQEIASMSAVWDELKSKLDILSQGISASAGEAQDVFAEVVLLAEKIAKLEGEGLSLFFSNKGEEFTQHLVGIRESLEIIESQNGSLSQSMDEFLATALISSTASELHVSETFAERQPDNLASDLGITNTKRFLDALLRWFEYEAPRRVQISFADGGVVALVIRGGGASSIEKATSLAPDATILFSGGALDGLTRITIPVELNIEDSPSSEKFLRLASFLVSADQASNIRAFEAIAMFIDKKEIKIHFKDAELESLLQAEIKE